MARSFGRLLVSFWSDKDVRPLSVTAKLMYGFLISQDDLEHSGIIPFRPQRWARSLNLPLEDTLAAVKELDSTRFTVTDEDEGELLVRSLIRRDDIWKQPNVFKAAAASAKAARSPQIKAALYHEIHRLDLARTNRETQAIRDELLTLLEPFAKPSPNPPEGFPKGSGGDDGGPAEGSSGSSANGTGQPAECPSVDKSARSGESAGQNPSGTLSEGQGNPSAGVQGKGEGYGPVLGFPDPHSPSPSPAGAGEPSRPLWPFAVPDDRSGEGDRSGDQTRDQLIATVRRLRPAWSTKSIERALDDSSVTERPWDLTCAAMVAVAMDPESKQPGRLAHDGPWWEQAGRSAARRPPWCGECRESTRRLEDEDGYDAGPCPQCNPKAKAS